MPPESAWTQFCTEMPTKHLQNAFSPFLDLLPKNLESAGPTLNFCGSVSEIREWMEQNTINYRRNGPGRVSVRVVRFEKTSIFSGFLRSCRFARRVFNAFPNRLSGTLENAGFSHQLPRQRQKRGAELARKSAQIAGFLRSCRFENANSTSPRLART